MPTSRSLSFGWLVLFTCLCLFTGCGRNEPEAQPDLSDASEDTGNIRLVSLAPALTQMVVDLGQARYLVGTAKNDMAAPADLPVVGDILNINQEALLSLRPTHVILMTTKEGVPKQLAELAKNNKFEILAYPSPLSIQEVGAILYNEAEGFANTAQPPKTGPLSIGTALGVPQRAHQLKLAMVIRLGMLRRLTEQEPSVTTLLVLSTTPGIGAVGPDTVHHELLEYVNAVNAAEDSRVGYPMFDKEKLLAAAPQAVVFLSPQGAELKGIDHDPRLAMFRGLDIPAVKNNRFVLLNHPTIMLPSSHLDHIAAQLAKALHPALADKIEQIMTQDLFSVPTPPTSPPPTSTPSTSAPATSPAEVIPQAAPVPAQH